MKNCSKCKIELPLWCFAKRGKDKNGNDRLRSECKDCKSIVDKTYKSKEEVRYLNQSRVNKVDQRNRSIVIKYLRENPCVDCGESDIVVLDFDHVRGIKELSIAMLLCRHAKEEKLREEISKCEVRCANCHRRATAQRGNFWKITA